MSHPVSISVFALSLSRRCIWLAVLAAAFGVIFTAGSAAVSVDGASGIRRISVPDDGIQPQVVVDDKGTIHLAYYKGDVAHGDLFYVKSHDQGASFSAPVPVNSQSGSAAAAGVIRGAQIAVGADGRVHVAWNGSGVAKPKGPLNPGQPSNSPHNGTPMLYARSNTEGTAFERQRNLMRKTFALDGGGSVAVDRAGHVFVTWHGLDRERVRPAGMGHPLRRQRRDVFRRAPDLGPRNWFVWLLRVADIRRQSGNTLWALSLGGG